MQSLPKLIKPLALIIVITCVHQVVAQQKVTAGNTSKNTGLQPKKTNVNGAAFNNVHANCYVRDVATGLSSAL